MFDEPIHVNNDSFDKVVLKSELPVVVDFWAPWCGPCRMMSPLMDQIAKEYAGKVLVAKVNIDENEALAEQYQVQTIPTLLFVKNGVVGTRSSGSRSIRSIKEDVDAML